MPDATIIMPNPTFGPDRRLLVQQLFARGAGHLGVIQDQVAQMTEADAKAELGAQCSWCQAPLARQVAP